MTTSHPRANARKAAPTEANRASPRRKPAATTKEGAAVKKTAAKKNATRAAKPKLRKPSAAPRTTRSKSTSAIYGPPRTRTKAKVLRQPDAAERLHTLVVKALYDLKGKDIQQINVRDKSSVTDLLFVVSGTSSRHVKSIADEVVKKAKHAGMPPIGVEGQREGEWVLIDLGDIIVHVMLPRTREFYALERLWTVGDAAPALLTG